MVLSEDNGSETLQSLTLRDYQALSNLRYALRRFLAFSTDAAQQVGLPPRQHQALLAIKGKQTDAPMTVGALAERLLIAPHSATELVGRLVKAGLVVRTGDANDRRKQALTLTESAETILQSLTLAHLREIREIAPVLMEVLPTLDSRQ
jgi:DNA-binding MarR family transcriptional regulator